MNIFCDKSSRQIALIAIGTTKIRGSGTGSWYVAKGIGEFFRGVQRKAPHNNTDGRHVLPTTAPMVCNGMLWILPLKDLKSTVISLLDDILTRKPVSHHESIQIQKSLTLKRRSQHIWSDLSDLNVALIFSCRDNYTIFCHLLTFRAPSLGLWFPPAATAVSTELKLVYRAQSNTAFNPKRCALYLDVWKSKLTR